MAAWLPIVKVVLPYVSQIFQIALPAFTKRKDEKIDPVFAAQIAELQEAVRSNAESSKILAKALEESAIANDRAIRQARIISLVSIGVALISLLSAAALWLR